MLLWTSCFFTRLSYDEHVWLTVKQDARDNYINGKWTKSILSLARSVCQMVSFDLRSSGMKIPTLPDTEKGTPENSDPLSSAVERSRMFYSPMDIRHYVHVKMVSCPVVAITCFIPSNRSRCPCSWLHRYYLLRLGAR